MEVTAMKFTPKLCVVSIACGVLMVAEAGGNKAINPTGPEPSAVPGTSMTNSNVLIIPAVERIPLAGAPAATANDFVTVKWYKSKHWWKKNAPIIGGAGGGALIGGLAGGGAGAIIGGAAGAGGGALYKHYKGHHRHNDNEYYRNGTPYTTPNPTPNYYEHNTPNHGKQ
jgi:hypothetical protein